MVVAENMLELYFSRENLLFSNETTNLSAQKLHKIHSTHEMMVNMALIA